MARDGLDVVLLERGTRPGDKNVMSGVLFTEKLHALIPEFAERAPLQRRITGGYQAHILGEDEVITLPRLRSYRADRYPHPKFTVFRSQFDAWFAQEAEHAGAELFTETLVEDLLRENGQVVGVSTRRGDLRAKVVIGADGVNSTVAVKSGLLSPPPASHVSLIVREILDLPAQTIEDRFHLRPGEGILSLYYGTITGPTGNKGLYYSELYTNQDSLSLTAEVPLDVLRACGVPAYEVLAERECQPYVARIIQDATLREYQAHLIPWGGVPDLGCLYGEGVLLAGDAGRFTTMYGVGSWPAMASGVAAARTVKNACRQGDFSKAALAIYRDLLDEEGLVETQREAREAWADRGPFRDFMISHKDRLFHLARRYDEEGITSRGEHSYSLWVEAYHALVKPLAPWYIRWPLGLAAWVDTYRWRRQQART
jgi:electron transfer flavoprotein-quinone oxidoreductase